MSAPAFAWALERGAELGLKPAERLVLLYLADMANGERVCWPGQPKICRFTGLAPNTVVVALRRLEQMQLIRAETRAGYVSRYHILRPVTPANGVGGTPANRAVVTPANGVGAPPQIVGDHPRKCDGSPPHDLRAPPPNRGDDPSITQEETLERRACPREGSQVLSFPGNGTPRPEPPTPPTPQTTTTTPGSSQLKPPPDDFNAWVDGLPPKRAIPLEVEQEVVRGDVLPEEDAPVDPGVALAVLGEVRRSLQMRAYPPRAAVLSPDEMSGAVTEPRRPKPAYLPDDTLAALRADARRSLARRAVVS